MLFSRWGSRHREFRGGATTYDPRRSPALPPELANSSPGPAASGRWELKYLLTLEDARRISRYLSAQLEVDPHAQGRPGNVYTVRSVYFDSPGLICYHAKENGGPIRQKYRVRTYDEPGSAAYFLERKARRGQVYRKEKVRLNDAWLACLEAQDGLDFAGVASYPNLLQRLLFLMDRHAFVPTVLIVYEREAYVEFADQDTVRITIDRNLRAAAFPRLDEIYEEEGLRSILTHVAVLEVKFTAVVPRTLPQLTRQFPLLRRACSKYATCIEHLVLKSPLAKEVWPNVRLF